LRIGVELVILFCDTSALMKLLVDETQSDQMRQISTTVDAIGVCRISWAETIAALARTEQRHHRPLSQGRLLRGKQGGPGEHGLSLGEALKILQIGHDFQDFSLKRRNPSRHRHGADC